MKKILLFVFSALAVVVVSCNKNDVTPDGPAAVEAEEQVGGTEIAFATEVPDAPTRATEVTTSNLSSIYVTATKTVSGTTSAAWSNVNFTKGTGSDTKYKERTNGGKWWPQSDESYKFYAANVALPTSGTTITVSPSNANTDIVVGSATPAFKTADIPLTLNHIFAQIGTIGVTVNSNLAAYAISGLTISFDAKTSGTYNIGTNSWTTKGTGSSMALVSGASIAVGGTFTTIANSDHRLVVPMEGSSNDANNKYQFTANFTITRGDYTKSVSRTAWVKLEQGKRNNIAADLTIGDDGAVEIQFTVTVTDWVDTTQNITF